MTSKCSTYSPRVAARHKITRWLLILHTGANIHPQPVPQGCRKPRTTIRAFKDLFVSTLRVQRDLTGAAPTGRVPMGTRLAKLCSFRLKSCFSSFPFAAVTRFYGWFKGDIEAGIPVFSAHEAEAVVTGGANCRRALRRFGDKPASVC